MPKLLYARPAADAEEERKIHKLARSRHAPADWAMRAKMIAASWDGDRTSVIAARLGCHMQTVRERLARFNAEAWTGLVTGPERDANAVSPKPSGARSSPWLDLGRRGGRSARLAGSSTPQMRMLRRSGRWTRWSKPLSATASRCSAARSAGS